MVKVAVMLAQGFEEIEALTVVDVFASCQYYLWYGWIWKSKYRFALIQVRANRVFDGDLSDYDMIVLPGGMPGSAHLRDNQALIQELQSSNKKGRN